MSWLFSRALMQDYENSRSSLGLVAEYSAANCSDGEPSAQLSGNPTPQAYLLPVKTMDAWNRFPSGITLSPLTESRGQDVLTWFLEGFPAKTLAQPEKVPESTEDAAECGEKWRALLAKYDPDSSSWKTAQYLLHGGLEQFSETWPTSGLMRGGRCYQLPMLEHPTSEHVSGSLLTPLKMDASLTMSLRDGYARNHAFGSLSEQLITLYNLRPSAAFVEKLMGWPEMWTDLQPLVTDKSHEWLQQHSESLLNEAA